MKYGGFIGEPYEAWMYVFDTLKEARAYVTNWRTMRKPSCRPTQITLVRIMSDHEEGDLS